MSDPSLRIVLERDELHLAQDLARRDGVRVEVEPQPHVVEPMTAILVAGGALLVAKFVVDLIDRLRGGLVIDLRSGTRREIRRDRGVPYGWVTIITADGTVKVETHDAPRDAAERLLNQILSGALTTPTQIANAASEALGPERVEADQS
jgi:hypothetical protein